MNNIFPAYYVFRFRGMDKDNEMHVETETSMIDTAEELRYEIKRLHEWFEEKGFHNVKVTAKFEREPIDYSDYLN